MTLVPEKLFINMYPGTIGPCVGSAYLTRADADRCANSHRLLCLETGVKVPNSVAVSEDCMAALQDLARRSGRDISWVVENAAAIQRAIPNEIMGLLHRYAAELETTLPTAVAECCRGYLTEATR